MRIQVVSDLHLEFRTPIPALAAGTHAIIAAGDIAPANKPWLLSEAVEQWRAAEHILYVPGNHEFFGSDIDEGGQILAGQCRIHGVTLLDRAAVTIGGVRFIGATLWTDFLLNGIPGEPAAHRSGKEIDDFDGKILHRAGTGRFTTYGSARRHALDRAFIERELAAADKAGTTAVVITHHAPTPRSIAPRWRKHALNPAFASDLERLIGRYQPPLWVHGHMHDPVDVAIGETRVLCNPAGYNAAANERRGYDPQLCVEIRPQGEAS